MLRVHIQSRYRWRGKWARLMDWPDRIVLVLPDGEESPPFNLGISQSNHGGLSGQAKGRGIWSWCRSALGHGGHGNKGGK